MPHIFVDGHVHLHPCFRLDVLLASALRNLQVLAQEVNAAQTAGFLLLTESAGIDVFSSLKAEPTPGQTSTVADFQIKQTGEAETLVVRDASGAELYLVAGRQIVTADRLEVLALGYDSSFPDGQPIDQVLAQLAAQASTESAAFASSCRPLAVVPWGAGKWLGTRGKRWRNWLPRLRLIPSFLGIMATALFFGPCPRCSKPPKAAASGIFLAVILCRFLVRKRKWAVLVCACLGR